MRGPAPRALHPFPFPQLGLAPGRDGVHDLRATAVTYDTAALAWANDEPPSPKALYLDGRLDRIVPADATTAALAGLGGTGDHDVTLEPIAPGVTPPAWRGEWERGEQPLMTWAPVDDPAVVAYRVTVGGVATVLSDIVVRAQTGGPDTGTGTGRIRFGGGYAGNGPVNGRLTVTIDTGGFATMALAGESRPVGYSGGAVIDGPAGTLVEFLDATAAYVAGDVYSTWVGPPTEWRGAGLPKGAYTASVAALTSRGLVGATVSVPLVVSQPEMSCLSTLAFDPTTQRATVTWAATGADAARVRLYANLDWAAGGLGWLEHVDEISPALDTTALSGSVEFDVPAPAAPRDLLVFVRAVAANDIEDGSLVALSLALPHAPAGIGTPVVESVSQDGEDAVAVVAYRVGRDGDPAATLHLTWTVNGTPASPQSASLAGASPGAVVRATFRLHATDGDTLCARAVAADAAGTAGPVSNSLCVTMAIDYPAAPSGLVAVPA